MMLMLDEDKLTRSKDKRTCLLVHRKVSEQHRAPGVIIYLEISGIIIYLQICLLHHTLFTLSLSAFCIPIITNPILLCLDGQPDWVGDISLLRYAKQLVWSELRGLGFSLKEELERGWWSHIICIISAVEGRWSENIICLGKSWPGDCVQVRVESIVEICVWLPDFLQHLHVEAQLVDHKVVRVLLQPLQALSDFQPLGDL